MVKLNELSTEQVKAMSLVDLCYVHMVEENIEKLNIYDFLDYIKPLRGVDEEEFSSQAAYFYTDLNLDGRFVCVEDGSWKLRDSLFVEDIKSFVEPSVQKFEIDDEELEELGEDEQEDVHDEVDALVEEEDMEENEDVYDFDNDGTLEKVVINRKSDSIITTGSMASIYTLQDGQYTLTYQIPLKNEINAFSVENTEKTLKSIKEFYSEYSKGIEKGEIRIVNILGDNTNENITLNLKYNKNSIKDIENFLFIGHSNVLRESPNNSSAIVASLKYKDKPRLLLEFISLKNNSRQKWYMAEFGEESKVRGYIQENKKVIKRGFYWDKMVSKMEKINNFISDTLKKNQDIYIITEYRPLANDYYSKKDKFGNRSNQSIKGYEKSNKEGEYINIPDRTLFRVLGEENGMIKIETPMYGGPYYIEKKDNVMQKANITSKVNKFVAIDPESQAEVIFERVGNSNKFNVVTYSFVTTGVDNGYSSYETPHGAFLVAFTRPYMLFTGHAREGDTRKSAGKAGLVIAGQADYAVRFSGGAYMHGIPASFGASRGTKAYTASKIGTYKESHKCVRHYDDQIKYIVDWINADSTKKEKENTIPAEPVVVVVL